MVGVSNLPLEQEDLLLEILLDKDLQKKKFSTVLRFPQFQDRVPTGSKERIRLTNRRQYLLNSPRGFRLAANAYQHRLVCEKYLIENSALEPTNSAEEEVEQQQALPSIHLTFDNIGSNMTSQEQDEYDMVIPLSWDPRYNVGSVQLSKGATETQNHEVRNQIRFSIQFSNAKD